MDLILEYGTPSDDEDEAGSESGEGSMPLVGPSPAGVDEAPLGPGALAASAAVIHTVTHAPASPPGTAGGPAGSLGVPAGTFPRQDDPGHPSLQSPRLGSEAGHRGTTAATRLASFLG
jgi:hypothetical protein